MMKRRDAHARAHARAHMRMGLATAIGVAVCAPIACSSPAVQWGEVVYPGKKPQLERPMPAVASVPADACPGSFRASAMGQDVYGAWWHVRPDSSALLMAGRSTDAGQTW
ncbi:MAG: hypothetical protein ACR2MQ_08995, partial [Gemmatimonadaceae bacterium]